MPETNKTQPDKPIEAQKNQKNSQRGLWIIIGIGCVVLAAVLVVGSFFIDAGKIRFITEFSLTVVLATLVGVQAYIYRRQWEVMEQQGVQIERQARYTEHSVKSARRHAIYTLRAYVNIRAVLPDFPKQILLEIVNFGQTPAHHVQFAHKIAVRPARENPEAVPESIDWAIPGVPLAPSMSIEKSLPLSGISEADIAKLSDPQYRLFIWGAIRYKDIFRRTRYTRFAAVYALESKKLGTCSKGNDAT
jgi:hypothetical protein